jgi:hypothetical protein
MQVRVLARVELAPVQRNFDNSLLKCKPSRRFLCEKLYAGSEPMATLFQRARKHACKTQVQMSVWRQHRHAIAFLFRNRCLADAHVNSPAGRLLKLYSCLFGTASIAAAPPVVLWQAAQDMWAHIVRPGISCPSPCSPLPRPLQRQHVSCTCTHIGLLYACIGASPGRSIFLKCFIPSKDQTFGRANERQPRYTFGNSK